MNNFAKARKIPKAPTTTLDAISLLKADHKIIGDLFVDYGKTRSLTTRKALVAEICAAMSVHMQIEEEIFYPAIGGVMNDPMLIAQADVEHAGIKGLVKQIEGVEPFGVAYDARVRVLGEYVRHHVKEEHSAMFPKVRDSLLDLDALGARMDARRAELFAAR